eukprot:SAG11_NODE_31268_length_293_cov_0.804124_1_plen_60_part_01
MHKKRLRLIGGHLAAAHPRLAQAAGAAAGTTAPAAPMRKKKVVIVGIMHPAGPATVLEGR